MRTSCTPLLQWGAGQVAVVMDPTREGTGAKSDKRGRAVTANEVEQSANCAPVMHTCPATLPLRRSWSACCAGRPCELRPTQNRVR